MLHSTHRQREENRRAAIICSHVAIEGRPILRAVRDHPTMPEDSGWQFLCGCVKEEDSDRAQVWLIDEVVNYDPTLAEFIARPGGTVLTRKDPESAWEVSLGTTTEQT